jgi:hypothetical protein
MPTTRRLFISYMSTGQYGDGFGFGQLDQEVDFPITDGEALSRAVRMGLERTGVTNLSIAVISWRFFEEE